MEKDEINHGMDGEPKLRTKRKKEKKTEQELSSNFHIFPGGV